jgi:hypothetical protein
MHNKNKFIFLLTTLIPLYMNNSVCAYQFPKAEDTPFGISAVRDDLLIEGDLQVPEPEADGKIATLNQTGFMTPDQNPYNMQFIEFASKSKYPSLDVGAAYGITVAPTLQRGGTIIANDIDERHLLLLRESIPPELRPRLILNKRRFPDGLDPRNRTVVLRKFSLW